MGRVFEITTELHPQAPHERAEGVCQHPASGGIGTWESLAEAAGFSEGLGVSVTAREEAEHRGWKALWS